MTFVNPIQNNQVIVPPQVETNDPVQEQHDRLMRIEIMDTIQTMRADINATLSASKSIHIPGTWEVITQFFADCCRWIGSLFSGRH